MRKTFSGYALGIGAGAALLAGCGGPPAFVSTSAANRVREVFSHHVTFHYTGAEQTFKIPAGVNLIAVVARGAGGGGHPSYGHGGGRGGRVFAELPVIPGERLRIFVGGTADGLSGGYNGGGAGQYFYSYGSSFGGGGATDIREGGDTLKDRVLVAGGGGGLGGVGVFNYGNYSGGGGGGDRIAGNGENGSGNKGRHCKSAGRGGGGASQQNGGRSGRGGCEGKDGATGALGNGGAGGYGTGGGGGGGGGGYYGGGGGGGGTWDLSYTWEGTGGGGGGGSSYVEPGAQKFRSWRAWKNAAGNGQVVITW